MSAGLQDQMAAAQRETREMLAGALGLPVEMLRRHASSPLIAELLDPHLTPDARRCVHLRTAPVQPWIRVAFEGVWRCRRCSDASGAAHLAPDAPGLGVLEEHTCDRCRRYTARPLTPLIVRADIFTVILAVCGRCQSSALAAGAELSRSA